MSQLRQALRSLLHTPRFTASAVLLIAFGLGMGLTLFNAVQALLWRGLPFPDASRLVSVEFSMDGSTFFEALSMSEVRVIAKAQGVEAAGCVGIPAPLPFSWGEHKGMVQVQPVNAEYLRALRLPMLVGRPFDAEVDQGVNTEKRVLLLEKTWRQVFGGDRNLVGQLLPSAEGHVRVMGVVRSPGTLPYISSDVGALSALSILKDDPNTGFQNFMYRGVIRLRSNLSIPQAKAALSHHLETTLGLWMPMEGQGMNKPVVRVRALRDLLAPQERKVFQIFLGLAALIVLLVCANVAGLFLARVQKQAHEEALHSALGENVSDALKRRAAEAFVVSAGGILLALVLERLLRPFVVAHVPELMLLGPEMLDMGPWLLGASGGLLALTTLVLAWLPTLMAARFSLAPTLSKSGIAATARQSTATRVLVAIQTALVLMLLTTSVLLGRSLLKARSTSPGFPMENLLVARIEMPDLMPEATGRGSETDRARLRQVYQLKELAWQEATCRSARSIPGIQGAALAGLPPVGGSAPKAGQVSYYPICPGALEVMGLPLLHGRTFSQADPPEAVVLNRKAAMLHFGTEQAAGRMLDGVPMAGRVIGVVGDSLLDGLDQAPPPVRYEKADMDGFGGPYLLLRGDMAPHTLAPLLADRITGKVVSVDRAWDLAYSTVQHRIRMPLVASVFSMAGLLLASAGLWASVRLHTQERRKELALRTALGCSPSRLLGSLLMATLSPVVIGILAGLLLSLGAGRLVQSQLFGVPTLDVLSFALGSLTLLIAALVTALLPALKAAREAPAAALKRE